MIEYIIIPAMMLYFYIMVRWIRVMSRSSRITCSEEKPLYIFVITSAENAYPLVSEINKLCTKTEGLSYVIMIVNDKNPQSEYNKQAKTVVRSMLTANQHTGYHPILAFKTSKEYRKFFTKSFEDICIVKDFSRTQDLLFRNCPGI